MRVPDHGTGLAVRSARAEDGFTLVEILATILVLSLGLLATMALVDGGNRVSARTLGREAGTNVARETLERAQRVGFDAMTRATAGGMAGVLSQLTSDPGATAATTSGSTRTVVRRGTTYSVTLGSCAIDDPSNGVGVVAGTGTVRPYCGAVSTQGPLPPGPTATSGTCSLAAVTTGTGASAGTSLGVQLVATGSSGIGAGGCLPSNVNSAICGLVGPGPGASTALNQLVGLAANGGVADAALRSLAGGGAAVQVCGAGTPPIAPDPNPLDPDDATRLTTTVTWTPPGGSLQTVTQSALVANPGS